MQRAHVVIGLLIASSCILGGCSDKKGEPDLRQIEGDFFARYRELASGGGRVSLVSATTSDTRRSYLVAYSGRQDDARQWLLEYHRSGNGWVLGNISESNGAAKSGERALVAMATQVLARLGEYAQATVVSNIGSHRYIKNGEQKAEVLLLVRRPGVSGAERLKMIFREQSGLLTFGDAYIESQGDYRRIESR